MNASDFQAAGDRLPMNTPLHSATDYGDPAMLALLLAHGADVNAVNAYGRTPLDIVTRRPPATTRRTTGSTPAGGPGGMPHA